MGCGEGAQRERRWQIEKARGRGGRKRKRVHHEISCAENKHVNQQQAEELEAGLYEQEHSAECRVGGFLKHKQAGVRSRRWGGATEAAGVLALSALRDTGKGLVRHSERGEGGGKRAIRVQTGNFHKAVSFQRRGLIKIPFFTP